MPEPIPLASVLSPDPFQAAAARVREAARPSQGRQEGATSYVLSNYLPHVLQALASLPQRALQEGANAYYAPERYDPGPLVETAAMMAGMPGVPAGAVGSSLARGTRGATAAPERIERAAVKIGDAIYTPVAIMRLQSELPNKAPESHSKI